MTRHWTQMGRLLTGINVLLSAVLGSTIRGAICTACNSFCANHERKMAGKMWVRA